MNKKISTSLETLCHTFPEEFIRYFFYCRNLKFEEEPDYKMLRGLFTKLFKENGFKKDGKWDWTDILKEKEKQFKKEEEEALKKISIADPGDIAKKAAVGPDDKKNKKARINEKIEGTTQCHCQVI